MEAASGRVRDRQVVFREVNDRIEQLDADWEVTGLVELLCECSNGGCCERVEATHADYQAARGRPNRFLVAPGHVAEEGERVIRRSSSCVVVEKTSATATASPPHPDEMQSSATITATPATSAATTDQGESPAAAVKLVFLYSSRSGRSRRTDGFLAQVLQRRRNQHSFQLIRVDVDEHPDLADRFRLRAVPTLLAVVDNRIRRRLIRPRSCREITAFLSPWLQ